MILKKRFILALKLGISAFLIFLLLSQIDSTIVLKSITGLAPVMAILAFVIILLQVVPAVLRWNAVLEVFGARLPFVQGCRIFLVGIFFNQSLPSTIGGDAVRVFICHRGGMTFRAAVNGVLLERFVTVTALVFLVLILQPLFSYRTDAVISEWFRPAVFGLSLFLFVGIVSFLSLRNLIKKWRSHRIISAISTLIEDAHKFLNTPMSFAKSFAWAIIGHLTVAFAVYVLAMGLNINVGLIECQVLVPLASLASMIPVSIAGWGMREGAMVVLFALVGVEPEKALALSVIFGLTVAVSGIPGGILWLKSDNRSGINGLQNWRKAE